MKQFFQHPVDPRWEAQREELRGKVGWSGVGRFFHLCEMCALSMRDENDPPPLRFKADIFTSRLRCQQKTFLNFLAALYDCGLATYQQDSGLITVNITFMKGRCRKNARKGQRFIRHPANFHDTSGGRRLLAVYKHEGLGRFFSLCEHLATSNESRHKLEIGSIKSLLALRGDKASRFVSDLYEFELVTALEFSNDGKTVTLEVPLASPPQPSSSKKKRNNVTTSGNKAPDSLPSVGEDPGWDKIVMNIPRREREEAKNLLTLYGWYLEKGAQLVSDAVEYTQRNNPQSYWPYLFHAVRYEYASREMYKERLEVVKRSQHYLRSSTDKFKEFCEKKGLDLYTTIATLKEDGYVDEETCNQAMKEMQLEQS